MITEADVKELLKLGKDHVFVWEGMRGMLRCVLDVKPLQCFKIGVIVIGTEVYRAGIKLVEAFHEFAELFERPPSFYLSYTKIITKS